MLGKCVKSEVGVPVPSLLPSLVACLAAPSRGSKASLPPPR